MVPAAVAESFVTSDPAVRDGVLANTSRTGWAVALNGFDASKPDESYFILRYRAGPRWVRGKKLTEQDIGAHFTYMVEQSKRGVVVAAGPTLAGDEGVYVVRGDKAQVDALINADPGVSAGTFAPQVIAWKVIAMQATR